MLKNVLVVTALVPFAFVGCARSPGSGLDEETQSVIDQASDDGAEALANSETNAAAIADLDTRVDTLEENGGSGEVQGQIDALESQVDSLQEDIGNVGIRLGQVEADWPPTDDVVIVDDKTAAGFPPSAPVANAEEGFSYVNQRLALHDLVIDDIEFELGQVGGALDTIELSYSSNLQTTVSNYITSLVDGGGITVNADLSFNPVPDVNPMDNVLNVKEYAASATLDEAIRALRYANQVKFVPPASDTRLSGLARNYVQEAIVALDKDLTDVIYGNIALDLNAGATVDGVNIATYISDIVGNDAALLQDIFSSTYFQNAVTNVIVATGVGNAAAAAVTVDTANLGDPADYATAQLALETLYASVQENTSDIAGLTTRVAATETVNTNQQTTINNVVNGANLAVTNLTTLQTAITNLTTAIGAVSASGVSFNNAVHPPFDNNNNTATVQVAIEDLHEKLVALGAQVTTITLGGTATDASLVTYTDLNNNATTVEAALDDIYGTVLVGQTVLANGFSISAGQDLNVGVQALDTALGDLAADLTSLTDYVNNTLAFALADIQADLAALEAQVATNTANIATNTGAITTLGGQLAINTNAINNLTTTVNGHTTQLAANTAAIAGNTAAIANLTTRLAALESFNTNDLATLVNAAIDARLVDVQAQIDTIEAEAGRAHILGVSATADDGRFEFGGETGIRAATAMCRATYANDADAHLCAPDEVQQALALGSYGDPANFSGVNTWTISGLSRRHNTEQPFSQASSLVTSCNNFLYNSGDVATGTRLRVEINMPSFGVGGQNIAGDAYIVQPNQACTTQYKVLCCR